MILKFMLYVLRDLVIILCNFIDYVIGLYERLNTKEKVILWLAVALFLLLESMPYLTPYIEPLLRG